MIDVSVIIPTFRRPERLGQAVRSVFAQTGLAGTACELVVVDNCPDGSAGPAVAALGGAMPVRYVHAPEPGVSHARNAGLDAAEGALVAFLDDDEIAAPGWLAALLKTRARFGAEIVFGPVIARHARDAEAAAFFTCASDAPTGTPVASSLLIPFWRRSAEMAYPRLCSGNVLMDAALLRKAGMRFDPRLGRTGGEDTLFFTQLAADGARMVWCAEAVVAEPVPDERTAPAYLAHRAFRGGQMTSYVPLRLRRRRVGLTALSMAIGAAQLGVYGPLAALHHLLRADQRQTSLSRAALAAGKLFWAAPFRRKVYG